MPIPRSPKSANTAWFSDETINDINRMARWFTPLDDDVADLARRTMMRARRLPKSVRDRPDTRFLLFQLMRKLALEDREPRLKI
ncbi:hypothetical protein F9K94_22560 [Brucella tritici]|uniref:Transposase n=1 Tax=Brucella tritici TaxID=94626 RepID=A0A7V7VQB1_9HYPH|nr:hypothetical protein [Brucella tritici]KAB2654853.1 hypothetical protein F9K94_22560 [Brucella tritici]